jgi:hypothetical protein
MNRCSSPRHLIFAALIVPDSLFRYPTVSWIVDANGDRRAAASGKTNNLRPGHLSNDLNFKTPVLGGVQKSKANQYGRIAYLLGCTPVEKIGTLAHYALSRFYLY